MKKVTGSILTVGGLAFLIYTGINYMNNSESFDFLGTDVVVSQGNIVLVVISAAAFIVGLVLLNAKK